MVRFNGNRYTWAKTMAVIIIYRNTKKNHWPLPGVFMSFLQVIKDFDMGVTLGEAK